MATSTLILFTNSFPYDKGEEFLETEILYLSQKFKKIILFPQSCGGDMRTLPPNCEVTELKFEKSVSVKRIILKHFITLLKIFSSEILLSKHRLLFIKDFKKHFNTIIWNISCSVILKKELEKHNLSNLVLYSYWFTFWGRLLSILKASSNKKIDFCTRIHGYDYEPSRKENNYIPFRNFEMNQVSKIFSISLYGINVIKREYPLFSNIHLSRLGVNDYGMNSNANSKVIHIVSCSSLIELKRVHLIIDILQKLTIAVKWTHFGNGVLYDDIMEKSKSLPDNIQRCFEGYKPNSYILNFYKTISVDLFINVSSIEGIPVSIMEAISFGIPVIGCDVGGVSEIVNEKTGFLIPKNFDPKIATDYIEKHAQKSIAEVATFRTGVKQFWNENYNAEKNYKKFVCQLAS